ncbi:MAG: hypothetical protein QOC65_151 [Sphingomonadales bacterium]|nr:hypothetical protein [Sphingomonadales bacterium]
MMQTLSSQTARPAGGLSLAGGLIAAAAMLFVAFAAEAMPAALAALRLGVPGPDATLSAALAVDVAILLFCWRGSAPG